MINYNFDFFRKFDILKMFLGKCHPEIFSRKWFIQDASLYTSFDQPNSHPRFEDGKFLRHTPYGPYRMVNTLWWYLNFDISILFQFLFMRLNITEPLSYRRSISTCISIALPETDFKFRFHDIESFEAKQNWDIKIKNSLSDILIFLNEHLLSVQL